MNPHFYFADYGGWRVLVTPWPMIQNAEGLVELSATQLASAEYAELKSDAEHFYRSAGERSAVLLYDVRSRISNKGPDMVASLWLRGPLAGVK